MWQTTCKSRGSECDLKDKIFSSFMNYLFTDRHLPKEGVDSEIYRIRIKQSSGEREK